MPDRCAPSVIRSGAGQGLHPALGQQRSNCLITLPPSPHALLNHRCSPKVIQSALKIRASGYNMTIVEIEISFERRSSTLSRNGGAIDAIETIFLKG